MQQRNDRQQKLSRRLFIHCLKGDSFNGNAFAAQALATGSAYAVIDEPEFAPANDPR
jgi:UDP-N-acetylmuramoyl-tripeptide--D-alanyl-D-alanine ligase